MNFQHGTIYDLLAKNFSIAQLVEHSTAKLPLFRIFTERSELICSTQSKKLSTFLFKSRERNQWHDFFFFQRTDSLHIRNRRWRRSELWDQRERCAFWIIWPRLRIAEELFVDSSNFPRDSQTQRAWHNTTNISEMDDVSMQSFAANCGRPCDGSWRVWRILFQHCYDLLWMLSPHVGRNCRLSQNK